MELELQNKGEEVTCIRNVGGNMILCAGIEIGLASCDWRSDALVFPPEFPPRFVVVRGLDFPGEHFPAPLVDEQAKRQKSHFVERAIQEKQGIIVRAQGEAQSAELIGEAIKNKPGFLALRRIDAARDIASIIANSQNRVLLDADSLMLNVRDAESLMKIAK